MEYKLTSDKISHHPLIKPLLEVLIPFFEERKIKFFIIGASARDIILELNGEKPKRKTVDFDIAIAIDKWSDFEEMSNDLSKMYEFSKDDKQKQRFLYKGFELDIVPYGGIMGKDERIYWPPDQTFAMNVLGFEEAEKHSIKVSIDEEIKINVVSLSGIFLLKIIAWKDRFKKTNKDADDIGFILQIYLGQNDNRAAENYYDEVYGVDDFTEIKAAGTLLGIDIRDMLGNNIQTKQYVIDILKYSLSLGEDSQLLNQILETNRVLNFEELEKCFENFLKELEKEVI